ncbi:helix-turn-helix domain-containing protein [Lapidilactobacillus dextrinicus]|uniref:helix-turn-helix domain-containing protein n=1 Tax=Lapidilactobacillus dextrinicus TaxID=51664 RepID=UPI003F245DD8
MTETNKGRLAVNIREIRRSLGETMEEFGKHFIPSADKSIVSRWELGKSIPNAKRLKKIAELGNVSTEFLLNGRGLSVAQEREMLKKARKELASSPNGETLDKVKRQINESTLSFNGSLNSHNSILVDEIEQIIENLAQKHGYPDLMFAFSALKIVDNLTGNDNIEAQYSAFELFETLGLLLNNSDMSSDEISNLKQTALKKVNDLLNEI